MVTECVDFQVLPIKGMMKKGTECIFGEYWADPYITRTKVPHQAAPPWYNSPAFVCDRDLLGAALFGP